MDIKVGTVKFGKTSAYVEVGVKASTKWYSTGDTDETEQKYWFTATEEERQAAVESIKAGLAPFLTVNYFTATMERRKGQRNRRSA